MYMNHNENTCLFPNQTVRLEKCLLCQQHIVSCMMMDPVGLYFPVNNFPCSVLQKHSASPRRCYPIINMLEDSRIKKSNEVHFSTRLIRQVFKLIC